MESRPACKICQVLRKFATIEIHLYNFFAARSNPWSRLSGKPAPVQSRPVGKMAAKSSQNVDLMVTKGLQALRGVQCANAAMQRFPRYRTHVYYSMSEKPGISSVHPLIMPPFCVFPFRIPYVWPTFWCECLLITPLRAFSDASAPYGVKCLYMCAIFVLFIHKTPSTRSVPRSRSQCRQK